MRVAARLHFAAAVLLAVACLAPAASQAASRAPIALGVNIANAPGYMAPMDTYVKLVHRRPALVMWYQQWSEPLFYSTQLPHVHALGALPLITWDPSLNGMGIPLSQIAAGRYDSYIRASARAAAVWKRPIYIRFAHEMNLSGSPFGPGHPGDSPTQFVRAWRDVVRIFRAEKATNVEWVWSPNVDCNGSCPFAAYYPGNRWVDWVALDGYNYSTVDDVPWETFASIFAPSYRILTHISDKPAMIAETASAPQGGSKAQWITRSFHEIPVRFPRIRAVVWFDRVKETNWTVNSSSASLRAWRGVVRSTRYEGTATTLLHLAPLSSDVSLRPVAAHRQIRAQERSHADSLARVPPSRADVDQSARHHFMPVGTPRQGRTKPHTRRSQQILVLPRLRNTPRIHSTRCHRSQR